MTSSNQGSDGSGGVPVRSTGRSFASMDPERVREVVGENQARAGAKEHEPEPAQEAGHERAEAAGDGRQPQSNQAANEGGGQDGSTGGSGNSR